MVQKVPNFILCSNCPKPEDFQSGLYGAKVGMAPKTLPVVDRHELCFMPTQDSYEGYLSIVNPDYYWSGHIPAGYSLN